MTQRQLAERADAAQSTIARIECGDSDPRTETLDRLLAACGAQLDITARPGAGVDRTQLRALLQLTPLQRLELLGDDAAGLSSLDRLALR